MVYTLHSEWLDGTFDDQPTSTFTSKRKAFRVAKAVAASATRECTKRILVCIDGEGTVASFPVADCAKPPGGIMAEQPKPHTLTKAQAKEAIRLTGTNGDYVLLVFDREMPLAFASEGFAMQRALRELYTR